MTSIQSSAGSLHVASWREQLSCFFFIISALDELDELYFFLMFYPWQASGT
jgi:hypothetical protein